VIFKPINGIKQEADNENYVVNKTVL